MQLNWTRSLWLWAGTLGLVLILMLPLSATQRGLSAIAVVLVIAVAWLLAGRSAAGRYQGIGLAAGSTLPASGFQLPIIAVCGDGLYALFGNVANDQLVLRVTERGCYLRVPSLEQLQPIIDYVLEKRPHWGGQLSALYIVNPAEQADQALLGGHTQTFRHQVSLVRRKGVALPVLLGAYLQGAPSEAFWFSWERDSDGLAVHDNLGSVSVAQWQMRPADTASRAARLHNCIQVESLANWLASTVLPHLSSREPRDPPCRPIACAMTLVPDALTAGPGNLWSSWLHERTALHARSFSGAHTTMCLPFPDPLLGLLPRQPGFTPARRTALRALWLFVLAAVLALCSAAWQNVLLLRQLSDDLVRYQAIPAPTSLEQPEHYLKEQAVTILRNDATKLDRYYRQGEPTSLGLGLYTAERLRRPILAALASHRVPAPASLPTKIPNPVRLDSLSLFTSGSAELRPGSTKVLVNALVGIKAQPGWLIVIAGHTDSTGDSARNLVLSRDRAGAVRDWMQKMGDLPDSCFAVQGRGAAQPVASNDTPEGRAANRRVDIRLVPEAGACALPAQAPEGQPQSPHYQATLSSQ